MQIVINIPLEWLFDMKNKKFCQTDSLYQKILNGTLLPKGHGRLIDADALKETFIESNIYLKGNEKGFWCFTSKEIKNAPTIIEADGGDKE